MAMRPATPPAAHPHQTPHLLPLLLHVDFHVGGVPGVPRKPLQLGRRHAQRRHIGHPAAAPAGGGHSGEGVREEREAQRVCGGRGGREAGRHGGGSGDTASKRRPCQRQARRRQAANCIEYAAAAPHPASRPAGNSLPQQVQRASHHSTRSVQHSAAAPRLLASVCCHLLLPSVCCHLSAAAPPTCNSCP